MQNPKVQKNLNSENPRVLRKNKFDCNEICRRGHSQLDSWKDCRPTALVFDVCHALSCARGGFVIMRHDEIRDITA